VGEALAASNEGDRLVVCPGWYDEEVLVDRAVRLESRAGPGATYLRGVQVSAGGARVAGFLLRSLEVEGGVEVELLGNYITREIYLPLVLKGWGN
jgi:hypothetical protein